MQQITRAAFDKYSDEVLHSVNDVEGPANSLKDNNDSGAVFLPEKHLPAQTLIQQALNALEALADAFNVSDAVYHLQRALSESESALWK